LNDLRASGDAGVRLRQVRKRRVDRTSATALSKITHIAPDLGNLQL
jgi:hypothetical protein